MLMLSAQEKSKKMANAFRSTIKTCDLRFRPPSSYLPPSGDLSLTDSGGGTSQRHSVCSRLSLKSTCNSPKRKGLKVEKKLLVQALDLAAGTDVVKKSRDLKDGGMKLDCVICSVDHLFSSATSLQLGETQGLSKEEMDEPGERSLKPGRRAAVLGQKQEHECPVNTNDVHIKGAKKRRVSSSKAEHQNHINAPTSSSHDKSRLSTPDPLHYKDIVCNHHSSSSAPLDVRKVITT